MRFLWVAVLLMMRVGTYNEMLHIEHDFQSLFLKPREMMMTGGTNAQEAKLTMQGAVEHLWSAFIEPMQQG
jgi:hypothetical protein